jgi:uncharacterized protein
VLEVRFYRDGRGRFAGLSASGHAEFAEYGEDIVCAAVSAILQAARLGVAEFSRGGVLVRQEAGELELTLPESERDRESLIAIVSAAELAVEQIARRYPAHVALVRTSADPREPSTPNG